jgi:hypothetical protein
MERLERVQRFHAKKHKMRKITAGFLRLLRVFAAMTFLEML